MRNRRITRESWNNHGWSISIEDTRSGTRRCYDDGKAIWTGGKKDVLGAKLP
jgi:hypothetical protein